MKYKHITGLLELSDFLRMPEGSVLIYELNEGSAYADAQNVIQNASHSIDGKVSQRKLFILDPIDAKTATGIQVTIVKAGRPRKRAKNKPAQN